ncbi:MAG: TorF family putative porin [Gammaproteobacteria bacterium]|nr:TorF family putative porin [Gammaproteobacteria bacterium]
MLKKSLILSAAVAGALSSSVALAVEGLSANAGVVSDYYFRGVQQTASASANGGVDYKHKSGFSVGIWAADVEGQSPGPAEGIEIDTYASYAGKAGDFGYSVGYTHYGYTGTFDTSYDEVNLGASYGDFALDVASGSHEVPNGTDEDYTFASVSYETGPLSVTYGSWGNDYAGAYLEVGLTTDIGGAEAGISFVNGDPDDGVKNIMTDGTALVFSISKSFDL